ncbi:MAG: SDR family oxidoreductase [Christensenellaceae bacterium]|jgi:NAD(P)-dependent dehydrogenase (short-subunit alcohol dehydrogenase family)|nr:SDR family oxidoreductase [Christensenellaceae bacterium]
MIDKTVVITGAAGVLCHVIAEDYARRGAKVALLDINLEAITQLADQFKSQGYNAKAYYANVLKKDTLIDAEKQITSELGSCKILINGAGGNNPLATTDDEVYDKEEHSKKSFFDLSEEGIDFVFNLNFKGTFLASQVFAKKMAEHKGGSILNISSMNAYTPLTKIPAYSAAKAAVSNFTEWLAVYFATSNIRVNAIAPGFFSTNQNKWLLFNKDGSLTDRSQKILRNTPMNRFGNASELLGAVRFFTDDTESSFVTGVVLPVDGGFNAFSGV